MTTRSMLDTVMQARLTLDAMDRAVRDGELPEGLTIPLLRDAYADEARRNAGFIHGGQTSPDDWNELVGGRFARMFGGTEFPDEYSLADGGFSRTTTLAGMLDAVDAFRPADPDAWRIVGSDGEPVAERRPVKGRYRDGEWPFGPDDIVEPGSPDGPDAVFLTPWVTPGAAFGSGDWLIVPTLADCIDLARLYCLDILADCAERGVPFPSPRPW